MKARFTTKCPLCRKQIRIGQEIVCRTFGRAVHAGCQAAEQTKRQKMNARTQAILALYERAGFR